MEGKQALRAQNEVTPSIELKNVSYVYSPNSPFELRALNNISLCIMQGECLGIIGKTGSGKSTLIQHLNGLLKPTSGEVLYEGQDIWKNKSFKQQLYFQVGLVFQYPEYQLFEETVYDDIAYGPRNMGIDEDAVRQRVFWAAEFAGLPQEILKDSPFEISGGQKRRAAIAGIIAMEPKVLVLDEPSAGLDPVGAEEIYQHIMRYRREKKATIIIVSHSMEDIAKYADRLAIIDHGSIPYIGTPKEIFTHGKELEAMGLTVPVMQTIFTRLYEQGFAVDPMVFTVAQARASFLEAIGKKENET